MNRQTVFVEKGTFRSRLIPFIIILFALSAACGVMAVASLFHPASIPAIVSDMILGQIYDPNARLTWLVIYIVLTAVNCLGTLVLSAGILLVVMGRNYAGMDLLYNSAKWMLLGVNISGAAVVPYFIFRAGRYIFLCCTISGGLIPLVSMLSMEALMVVQAYFLFAKLRQFLDCSMDAAASIGYTISSGKLKAPSIPPFSATGFLVLALFDIGIALDRFFTFIHIQSNLSVTYKFPMTTDPVQIISGLSFCFAAVGSILMYAYLRGYKSKSEKLLLRPVKNDIE